MQKPILIISILALLLLSACSLSNPADFEGVIEMKLSGKGAPDNVTKYSISKLGIRIDSEINDPRVSSKTFHGAELFQFKNTNSYYSLSEDTKTYQERTPSINREQAAMAMQNLKFNVKNLAKETVQGYSCVHVLLTSESSQGGKMELWSTKDLVDVERLKKAWTNGASGYNPGMEKAMKDADADGFPMKFIWYDGNGEKMIISEVLKVEKRALPAALFEVPADYTKK